MYDTFLFDLDGTLSDPGEGITNSVAYALKKWGIEVEDNKTLYPFIGPPLYESFMKYYGFSEEDAKRAVEAYREYFGDKGIYENTLYSGVKEMLSSLKNARKTIILATSKPEEFAVRILDFFGISEFFDAVAGATMDGTRLSKADVITFALEKYGGVNKKTALMVGDREHDILGAKAVGLDSLGITYGYGSFEELKNAGATYIENTVADIMKYM